MSRALAAHKKGRTGVSGQVTPLSATEIERMLDEGAVFIEGKGALEGAVVGYIEKDGYFGGLIKNPDVKVKGVQKAMTRMAVENGATHLECYATFLEGNNLDIGSQSAESSSTRTWHLWVGIQSAPHSRVSLTWCS